MFSANVATLLLADELSVVSGLNMELEIFNTCAVNTYMAIQALLIYLVSVT